MRFAADLHIHSHFSLATSRQLVPEHLDLWARIKGLSLLGTGDFTHPGWLEELKEKLVPAGQGLFRLKPDFKQGAEVPPVPTLSSEVRFILSAEISTIYKKNGRVRKVHSVILAPDFASAEKINQALLKLEANLSSDGRPILGLDARNLLEITLESSPDCLFIPAHIWTPWFSVLGSKSGFDNVKECFDDLTPHIKAVETGLSTDPAMNAICSFLDAFTLLSNSDAHSPEKLGRNANLFDCPLDYYAVKKGLTGENPDSFLGTIDLYPQEGKYHYDGHRKCGVRWDPLQTLENQGLCPHCGRPVTIGVMNRVAQLADRTCVSTFHALGYGLLQTFHQDLGRSRKFTLIDENERIKVLMHICHIKPKDAGRDAGIIKGLKQRGTDPEKAFKAAEEKRLFYAYEQALKEAGLFDIDDCIFQPLQFFARHPEIRDQFRRRFQWILIDEYQDINPAQYHFLLNLAAEKNPNLIVIGDPDQAIYGFRGASVRFIRRFQKDFPRACVYPLTQSFRCSNTILSASCDVISSASKGRMEGREEGVRIILTSHRTDKSEAEFIARTIEDMIGGLRFFSMDSEVSAGYSTGETQSLSDFAVLARTHDLLVPLEKAFADHSIPCQVVTSLPFTQQEPSRSVIELLKLTLHPQLARLRKQPPPENLPRSENRSSRSLLQDIIQRFFPAQKNECEPLMNLASRFSSPEEFLRNITLGSGIEGYDSTLERAVLMTLHAAKGLEFPCVFIIGCSDKLLPYNLFPGQKCDEKEEERLLYVGMTRAQKYLFLSHTEKRHIYGRNMSFSPSPFIERIKSDWLHRKQADLRRRQYQFSLFDKPD